MKEMLKKYKSVGFMLGGILLLLFFISIFNYFGIINSLVAAILNMLIGVTIVFRFGMWGGKKRENKGYLAGIKIGLVIVVCLFLATVFLFRVKINPTMIIYYVILLLSCIFGSVLGINKRKSE